MNHSLEATDLRKSFQQPRFSDGDKSVRIEIPTRLKDKCLDTLLLCMVLVSITGLIYTFVHR